LRIRIPEQEDIVPRVVLREQEEYEFIYKLAARIGHLNYSGHVGHDAVIAMVWEARVHFFHALGLAELDLGDGETGIIMTDLAVTFKKGASLFEEITIESHVAEIERNGFRIFHRLHRAGELIALVETGFAAFNYKIQRVAPVPQTFISLLENHKKKHLSNRTGGGDL
jgi:acyl-CoA thioester hydrolase